MLRLPPRFTRLTHTVPTRRSSDLRRSEPVVLPVRPAARPAAVQGRDTDGPVPDRGREAVSNGCPISGRSEEHTSELQSLMRISYAVFCLKKKNQKYTEHNTTTDSRTAYSRSYMRSLQIHQT